MGQARAMEGRLPLSWWQNATKETITDCEIVYNPAVSCVKLLVGGKAIQRMGHLRAGEIRERWIDIQLVHLILHTALHWNNTGHSPKYYILMVYIWLILKTSSASAETHAQRSVCETLVLSTWPPIKQNTPPTSHLDYLIGKTWTRGIFTN